MSVEEVALTITLNGNLHYPNDVNRSINETTVDKISIYHADYNDNPPDTISFMTVIGSTSTRIHSEFVRLLFLQDHKGTDRFFAASGVLLVQLYVLTLTLTGCLSLQEHTHTHHTRKRLVY
jgi:hypothetical protein